MIDLRRLAVLAALAAACDKPSDLPQKRDEVLAAARGYQARFDDLKQRAEELDRRLRALPAATLDSAATQHTLALARTTVDRSRARLGQLPAMLVSWMKLDDAREVQKLFDGLRHELDNGAVEATSEIAAVESWTSLAEHHLGVPLPAPPRMPDEMPGLVREPAEPAPESPPESPIDERMPPSGSAAPVR
ncbi:MAG: hypothetical protein E6J91_09970 [Deltaproteobacteria bacterium]|nr:MAG: hypothetical protein E6J91_09970 [Deltaproteobacteria bacterium]